MEFYKANPPPKPSFLRSKSLSLNTNPATNTQAQNTTGNPKTRRGSLVLTPAILDEYSKNDEETESFKRKYEIAHYNVYGSHVPLKPSDITQSMAEGDATVYSHFSSDPRLVGMGFFDRRRASCPCITTTGLTSTFSS